MMKRIIATILSLFYLALSTSAVINLHYCGGHLKSINFNQEGASCCCGDIDMSNSCCQNKELNLELDIDQQLVSISNVTFQSVFLYNLLTVNLELFQETEVIDEVIDNYHVPPPKLIPIWKENCSFRYYG